MRKMEQHSLLQCDYVVYVIVVSLSIICTHPNNSGM